MFCSYIAFSLESDCLRCVACRKQQQGLERHRQRYEELFHVQGRTNEQHLEFAECALSLAEAGVFEKRQLERVRATLKNVPADSKLQALWERLHILENGG